MLNKHRPRWNGQISLATLIMVVVGVAAIAILLPIVQTATGMGAIERLESEGYVVFAAGEYSTLNSKLDALKVSADAAAVSAVAAAATAQDVLDKLELHTEHEAALYPDSANATATFTAGGSSDTFGAWAEIVDDGAVTLSSKFAAGNGYLQQMMTRDYSDANKIYLVEISYGAAKTVVGRVKVRSDWTYVSDLNSVVIPAGETVYYRMRCEVGGATLVADFRYYVT